MPSFSMRFVAVVAVDTYNTAGGAAVEYLSSETMSILQLINTKSSCATPHQTTQYSNERLDTVNGVHFGINELKKIEIRKKSRKIQTSQAIDAKTDNKRQKRLGLDMHPAMVIHTN